MAKEQYELAVKLAKERENDSVIVIYDDSFHEGIVGIIAGRLKELLWKPTIVLAKSVNGSLKGSGRSMDEIPLIDALNACSMHLTTYGGHAKAAGLFLPADNLDIFRKAINAYGESYSKAKNSLRKYLLLQFLQKTTLQKISFMICAFSNHMAKDSLNHFLD